MDDYAFRVANRIVGNTADSAGLETTLQGPVLKFHSATVIALTGGDVDATLDGQPIFMWTPVTVAAGQTLIVGRMKTGCRTYYRRTQWLRRAAVSRQSIDVRARSIRRTRGAHPETR